MYAFLNISTTSPVKRNVIAKGKKDLRDDIRRLNEKYFNDLNIIREKYEKPNLEKLKDVNSQVQDNRSKVKSIMKDVCESEIEAIKNMINILSESNKTVKDSNLTDDEDAFITDDFDDDYNPHMKDIII